jgi:hypothetical protein
MFFFLFLTILFAVLKLFGVLLLGWWIGALLATLTLLFLILGENKIG